jgi:TetR/AcrR family transcriptional regulator, transcriptional repressor for nem operon
MVIQESKRRILAAAKELFLARGYAGTTVDAICEKAGLTKGSFYHFFDSKEELGLAVLDWSLQRSGQMLSAGPHRQIADPVQRALAFIDHIAICSPELWSGGCLLGSFALELAEANSRMQKAVSGMFQAVSDNFAEMLEPLVAPTNGKEGPTAEELADQLLGTLEGSIVLAKAHRDPSRIPKAIRAFRLAIATPDAQPA